MSLHTLHIGLLLCTILFKNNFISLSQNLGSSSGTDTGPGTTPSSPSIGGTKTKISLITIDIKARPDSGPDFNFKEFSKSNVFTASERCGFNVIKYGDIKIWRAESDDKYATVAIIEDKKILKLTIVGGQEKIIKSGNGIWLDEELFTSIDNSKNTPFVLYLDKETSTDNYEFTKTQDGKIKTYTAKDSYVINDVKLLENNLHIGRADRYIFKPSDPKFYATKVVLTELGSWKLKLDIELSNILRLKYFRPAWGSQWSYKGFVVFSHMKPIFLDINKKESTEEVDFNKDGNKEVFTPKDKYLFESIFATGTGCKSNSYIWTSDDDKSYSNKVEMSGNIISIYQSNGIKKTFRLESQGWFSCDCVITCGLYLCFRSDKYVEESSVAITNEEISSGSKPSEASGIQGSNPIPANESSNPSDATQSGSQTPGGGDQSTT